MSGAEREAHRGSVDRSPVRHVQQHELDTAQRLADLGEHVKFTPAPQTHRGADVEIGGEAWEFKSPLSNNPQTIKTLIGKARGQAPNVVLDVARTAISTADAEAIARQALHRYPEIEVIRIIGRQTADGPLDITIRR